MLAKLCSFWRLQGWIRFLVLSRFWKSDFTCSFRFQNLHSLAHEPFLYLQRLSVQPLFPLLNLLSPLWPSCLLLIGTLWLHRTCLENLGKSPHLKIPSLISSSESPLCEGMMFSQVTAITVDIFGGHYSTYHSWATSGKAEMREIVLERTCKGYLSVGPPACKNPFIFGRDSKIKCETGNPLPMKEVHDPGVAHVMFPPTILTKSVCFYSDSGLDLGTF